VGALFFPRGAGVQDLQAVTPKCPESLRIDETDSHPGGDSACVLLHGIGYTPRNALGSDNSDRDDSLRTTSGERLGLEDRLRQQGDHPVATALCGPLDLYDVLAPSPFHNEVRLQFIAGPRAADPPGRPAKSVGHKPAKFGFSGSHDIPILSRP
jgi:hypothetical protein